MDSENIQRGTRGDSVRCLSLTPKSKLQKAVIFPLILVITGPALPLKSMSTYYRLEPCIPALFIHLNPPQWAHTFSAEVGCEPNDSACRVSLFTPWPCPE